ncbi:MAG: OmpA family protein [Saprospiraceae bacterium]|jgi:outer membrane protein OmpA-like peptidoglycan-associated protein
MRWILFFLVLLFTTTQCTYTQKVKDGRFAFEREQYAVALKFLNKEYKKAESRIERGNIAYLIGRSLANLNRLDESVNWFKIAYDNQYGIDALREYAFALKAVGNYEEAIQAFRDLGFEIGSPYEYRMEIKACELAIEWENQPAGYAIQEIALNTSFSDYSPSDYAEGIMYFSSDRTESTGEENYERTGRKFSDIFEYHFKDEKVLPLTIPAINTVNHEANFIINRAQNTAFFTRCTSPKGQDAYCKIFTIVKENGAWTLPKPLPFQLPDINYAHPSLSFDEQTLYFTCNDPNGFGGYDIWKTTRNKVGWNDPELLGRGINSPGNEQFPVILGDTLYFSSDYHPGLGGLDIFQSVKISDKGWTVPFNLKPPINSGNDDFSLLKLPDGQGFFTSKRVLEGVGEDDIFSFVSIPVPDILEEIAVEEPDILQELGITLRIYVLEKIYANPEDPQSKVLGRKPLTDAKVMVNATTDRELSSFKTNEEGYIDFSIEEETNYQILASKVGFLNNQTIFNSLNVGLDYNQPNRIFELEIELEKIFEQREITLANVYYDLDKWDIREDAAPVLNKLSEVLQLNPNISIELASHTDCRGQDKYNQELSQKRAQSVVNYLIDKGINANRLGARGYGETVPVTDCICARCTEDEHQKNRRTTFKIVDSNL